jgi:hypothetical protein
VTDQPDPHNLGLMLGRMDAKLDGLKETMASTLAAHARVHEETEKRLKVLERKNLWDRAVFTTLVSLVAAKDYLLKVLAIFGAH